MFWSANFAHFQSGNVGYLRLVVGPVWPEAGVIVCAYRRVCVCVCLNASACLISMRGHVLNAYCKRLGENQSQGSRSHAARSGSADRGGGSRAWEFFIPQSPPVLYEILTAKLWNSSLFTAQNSPQAKLLTDSPRYLLLSASCWKTHRPAEIATRLSFVYLLYMHVYAFVHTFE